MSSNINFFPQYVQRLYAVVEDFCWDPVECLALDLHERLKNKKKVFLCGNGGSAANALHIANDLHYGCTADGKGLNAVALTGNTAIVTCLANDLGYENIFANQIEVQGNAGDLLIALSGSGNSRNIVAALEQARYQGIKSYAILGYSGGRCKEIADVAIHFPVDDMQVAEDLQLIIGHMLMQWLLAFGNGQ